MLNYIMNKNKIGRYQLNTTNKQTKEKIKRKYKKKLLKTTLRLNELISFRIFLKQFYVHSKYYVLLLPQIKLTII